MKISGRRRRASKSLSRLMNIAEGPTIRRKRGCRKKNMAGGQQNPLKRQFFSIRKKTTEGGGRGLIQESSQPKKAIIS